MGGERGGGGQEEATRQIIKRRQLENDAQIQRDLENTWMQNSNLKKAK